MANVLYALDDRHRSINNIVGRPFDSYIKAIAWGRSQLADSPFVVADGPRQYLVNGDDVWVFSVSRQRPLQMQGANGKTDQSAATSWPSPTAMRDFLERHKADKP